MSQNGTSRINFDNTPISALRDPTLCFLSQSLNAPKIIPAENNCQRDWRGFAHLAGINVPISALTEKDPMLKVLTVWMDNKTATFQNLLTLLGNIDRWDVADDVIDSLTEDAQFYVCNERRSDLPTEHNDTSELITLPEEELIHEDTSQIPKNHHEKNRKKVLNIPITSLDVDRVEKNLPLQRYDAFLIFADADLPLAAELVNRMENHPKFKFVLCLKDRDILAGISFEHDAVITLIRERCNRVVVIVSNAFLVSSLNNFFVQYAAALQIEKGCRKIIPCLYENCKLPQVLNCFSCLKYHQSGILYDFWSRLSDSLRAGRLQYAMTMNALSGTSIFPFEQDKDEISETNFENYIPMTEFITSNIEDLNVGENETEVYRTRNIENFDVMENGTERKTRLIKWHKRLKRRLRRIFF